jgi:hypothetical protein
MSEPTNEKNGLELNDEALFTRLSRSAKHAFSVSEAVRSQLNDPKVEIGHLLYGLYRHRGATRTVLMRAGIFDDKILEALGIARLDRQALPGKIEAISGFPPLHQHTQRALARAEEIRAGRANAELRMRYLLSAILSLTECSVVRNLVSNYGVGFDLDSYEKEEQATSGSSRQELTAKAELVPTAESPALGEDSESVLLAKRGNTEILVRETRGRGDFQLKPSLCSRTYGFAREET